MKIYVVCDLEGVAGVIDHRQQCQWDLSTEWFGRYYEQARRLAPAVWGDGQLTAAELR